MPSQKDGNNGTELSFSGMECHFVCLSMCDSYFLSSKKVYNILLHKEEFCKKQYRMGSLLADAHTEH